jgi:predicted SAM-dependent methyltransferase
MEKMRLMLDYFWYARILRGLLNRFKLLNKNRPLANIDKVIIGAGSDKQDGFLSTDFDELDVTKLFDWLKVFKPNTLSCLIGEHLFEHLTQDNARKALCYCYIFLKPGGRLRIAVPDRNRRDEIYVHSVKPPADGHKTYFNFSELSIMLNKIGFKVELLEYHDNNGNFRINDWDEKYGKVKRSSKYDRQKDFRKGKYYYTSLIVDAIKPV